MESTAKRAARKGGPLAMSYKDAVKLLHGYTWDLIHGDAIAEMAKFPDNHFDSVVCDPPYGIRFMGKAWDHADIQRAVAAKHASEERFPHDTPTRRNRVAFTDGGARMAGSYDLSPKGMKAFQLWCEQWGTEAIRVLKPGGHLLAFGSPRTYHRLAVGLEDAGFEIRDSLIWLFGQGMPKSHNVSKAIDKLAGAEREVVGQKLHSRKGIAAAENRTVSAAGSYGEARLGDLTIPATEEAKEWDGWGTGLKPGYEPIVVARKPFAGTVATNVLEHGTGAINIDATRIPTDETVLAHHTKPGTFAGAQGASHTFAGAMKWQEPKGGFWRTDTDTKSLYVPSEQGRWPANVVLTHHLDCVEIGTQEVKSNGHWAQTKVTGYGEFGGGTSEYHGVGYKPEIETVALYQCHSDCPVRILDEQTGTNKGAAAPVKSGYSGKSNGIYGDYASRGDDGATFYGDKGGASRFFYCPKPSRSEKNAGLDDFLPSVVDDGRHTPNDTAYQRGKTLRQNTHPTVKSIALMQWLIKLVTPPKGLILDCFCGSGTTLIAAMQEGFYSVGIDNDASYCDIARARLRYWNQTTTGGK